MTLKQKKKKTMTRTQNIKKNLIFNVIRYATNILLQFVLRTVLIYYMGAEYLGLNGLFTNIFSFLNLAELGIGGAIVFSMYKPIAENDIEKVKALQNLYKKFYIIIAIVVGVLGAVLTPFIKYFMNGGVEADINIYILYVMYLAYTLVGYFSAHKRSLLFAYQRNDIENKIKTVCSFLMVGIQIAILILTRNYYFYFSVSILFALVEGISVQIVANKLYPEINGKAEKLDDLTKKEITKNVTALSLHKVGKAVVFSTDNILVSTFLGLAILGVYTNYSLIITTLTMISQMIYNAITASAGDLIASSSTEYVYERYKKTNFIFSYYSGMTTICLVTLFQPFIAKWTGDASYLLDFSTVLLLCVSYYLTGMRTGVWVYKDAAGLFDQDKWKPIAEALVNLVVSVGLAYVMGINGIVIGTIVSTLVAPFWVEPYVLYKYYFKKSTKPFFLRYALDVVITLVCGVATYFICSFIPTPNILLLAVKFVVCFVLANVLLILAYLPTGDIRNTFQIVKSLFNRKTKVKRNNNDISQNDDLPNQIADNQEKDSSKNEETDNIDISNKVETVDQQIDDLQNEKTDEQRTDES